MTSTGLNGHMRPYLNLEVNRRRVFIALSALAVITIAMTSRVLPHVWQRAIDDLGQAIAAAIAVAACGRARERNQGRSRLGWTILGTGVSMWLLGQVYWIVIEV